jgi:two-component system, chemotaxis family, sensor kinase CheA
MPQQETISEHLAGLQSLVNSLAMRFVLGGPSDPSGAPAWLPEIEEVVRKAAGAGMEVLADEVAQLRDRLVALGPDSPELQDAAQAGIQGMQEVLEARRTASRLGPPAPAAVSLVQDPELVADFIVESREHLQAIERNVLALERDPGSMDSIHSMFRAFHTIKGIAGFLELQEVRDVSHETETLLDQARNGALELGPRVVDVILESADYLGREVRRIEAGSREPAAATGDLLEKLQDVVGSQVERQADPDLGALSRAVRTAGESAGAPALAAEAQARKEAGAAEATRTPDKNAAVASSVKVDTAKLDFLVDMVGEMVIAQSLVRHSPDLAKGQSASLLRNVAQLSRITDEIQKMAMSMRMVPVAMLFQKMARLVRDLSRKAGKQAELVTFGEDTELDRNIVEELADPLMHMVRNSIDHGIELPADRLARGKPASARVELRASHQGGQIVIEVADDGRGMDREAILRKARDKGLAPEGAMPSDTEIFNLIFEPGFSTAEKVTDISGRGVGMDVVKRHIQKLRGRTEITTAAGKGTTFRLKLPLTLAIVDGLIVGVGAERYIVPIFAVKEILRPTAGMVSTVEGKREIALVRDRVLPVIRLHRRFGVTPRTEDPLESLLVITESQGTEYCLMVDALHGKQEVVIKSLGETLKNVSGVAGGAILGDGRVGLILEMNALFNPAANG